MIGDTIADRHVHPATVPLRFLKEAPSTLLGLPAVFALVSDVGWRAVLGFALVTAGLLILSNWIAWSRFRYGVGTSEIVIESGLLNRTRRSIPFARIQDVDVERGPLQRLFGLAKVRIETGGSGKDEGVLDSVSLAEADRLRLALRAGRNGASPARGEALAIEAGPPVFAMSHARVLLSGVFNFSLIWIAGLFALLQAFDDWLPFDIYDPGRLTGLIDEQFAGRFAAESILAVLLLALFLGFVTGVARTVSRDFGFRLVLEGERFRRERGLLTRTEIVIPRSRVQLARVRTGPVRRFLGWFELSFQTLSAGKGGGQQSVAPMARANEVTRILDAQEGLCLPSPADLMRVSRRHLVRTFLRKAPVPLIVVAALAVRWPAASGLLILLPLIFAAAHIESRHHRYGLSEGLLFIQRGLWRQQLWIIPVARAQTLRLSRTWLQRRLGLSTLRIDTAGGPPLNVPRIEDLREEEARRLAAELLAGQDSGRKSGTER